MVGGKIVYNGDFKNNQLLVRYPTRDDIAILLQFINTVSKEQTYILKQGEQMTMEEETKYIENYIKKIEEKKAVKLLVFCKDELIGVADVTLKEKVEKHIGVFGIIITPEWRGKGIGTFLLKLTLKEAEEQIKEMRIVTLGVFSNNPIAKKLYEKIGFVEYGNLKEGLMHRGTFVDHVYMFKKISNGTG